MDLTRQNNPATLPISTPAELKKNGSTILIAARQKLLANWYTTPSSKVNVVATHLDTLHKYLSAEDPAECPFLKATHAAKLLQNYLFEE
jgi:hypothetical protein